MTCYFFHHPLDSRNGIPGRYAFSVSGLLVSPDGATSHNKFTVSADGLGDDSEGTNVDPCIFASPLSMVHSFCRIDRRGGKYYVPKTRLVLSEIVRPGDTIFYGHLQAFQGKPRRVYVDTIMVVSETISLPTFRSTGRRGKRYRFITNAAFAEAALSSLRISETDVVERLVASDLWKFNLRDTANENSNHGFTGICDHKVIVGATATLHEAPQALQRRTTSFVPLVESRNHKRALPPSIDGTEDESLWRSLCDWTSSNPRLIRGMKPPTPMPDSLGEGLYDTIRRASGRGGHLCGHVGLPPFSMVKDDSRSSHVGD